jgi:hypothetical protein
MGDPAFDPDRLVGDHGLLDDGWRCSLRVERRGDGWTSRFRSYDRNEGEFASSLTVGGDVPHRVTLTVYGFNELDAGVYVGHASRSGPVHITGWGDWKGTPFGFVTARRPPFRPGPDLPGTLLPDAFLGTYRLVSDALAARVALTRADGRRLTGEVIANGTSRPISGEVDEQIPHRVVLIADLGAGPVTLTLLMFVRSRSVLAGRLERDGQPAPCHLTRLA